MRLIGSVHGIRQTGAGEIRELVIFGRPALYMEGKGNVAILQYRIGDEHIHTAVERVGGNQIFAVIHLVFIIVALGIHSRQTGDNQHELLLVFAVRFGKDRRNGKFTLCISLEGMSSGGIYYRDIVIFDSRLTDILINCAVLFRGNTLNLELKRLIGIGRCLLKQYRLVINGCDRLRSRTELWLEGILRISDLINHIGIGHTVLGIDGQTLDNDLLGVLIDSYHNRNRFLIDVLSPDGNGSLIVVHFITIDIRQFVIIVSITGKRRCNNGDIFIMVLTINFDFRDTAVAVDDTRIQTEQRIFGDILRLALDDEMIVADALKFLIERVVCVVIIAVPVLVDGNGTLEILLTGRIVVGNIHTLIDRDIFPGHGIHCRQCVAVCICSDSGSVIVFVFVPHNLERYACGRIHCFGNGHRTGLG